MGTRIFDQYTILHFAVGIVSYFWGVNFLLLLLMHTLFEILENTKYGMYIINNYIYYWPGGKPNSDNIINRVGDTIGAISGWLISYYLDIQGIKNKWYINNK